MFFFLVSDVKKSCFFNAKLKKHYQKFFDFKFIMESRHILSYLKIPWFDEHAFLKTK